MNGGERETKSVARDDGSGNSVVTGVYCNGRGIYAACLALESGQWALDESSMTRFEQDPLGNGVGAGSIDPCFVAVLEHYLAKHHADRLAVCRHQTGGGVSLATLALVELASVLGLPCHTVDAADARRAGQRLRGPGTSRTWRLAAGAAIASEGVPHDAE